MPTLEIIHDRFVRLFRLTLSNALRRVVDISVRSTELIKFVNDRKIIKCINVVSLVIQV